MTERRAARRAPAHQGAPDALPAELAMGPCLEVWADRGPVSSTVPWMRARRAWQDAVAAWAEATGWASERRPALNARNLARTSHPWSRQYLLSRGERELVDYLEGRRPSRPESSPKPWQLHGREGVGA